MNQVVNPTLLGSDAQAKKTSMLQDFAIGFRDLRSSGRYIQVAFHLSVRSTRSHFRRTFLGPMWFVIEQVLFTFGFSIISASLLGGSFEDSISYVGFGILIFSFLSDVTVGSETCLGTVSQNRSLSLPISVSFINVYISKVQTLGYRLLGFLIVALTVGKVELRTVFSEVPALVMSLIFGLFSVFLFGTLMIRFRDLKPMFGLINRLMFFVTPVFWRLETVQTTGVSGRVLIELQNWNPYTLYLEAFERSECARNCIDGVLERIVICTICTGLLGVISYTISVRRIRLWTL